MLYRGMGGGELLSNVFRVVCVLRKGLDGMKTAYAISCTDGGGARKGVDNMRFMGHLIVPPSVCVYAVSCLYGCYGKLLQQRDEAPTLLCTR